MAATVTVIYGLMGEGKTAFATWLVRNGFRGGRRQWTSYPTMWSHPLMSLGHAWCKEFAHSDMTLDESASSFNARDFKDWDRLIFGAVSHARHRDVRIRFICQHPRLLEVNYRTLAHVFVHVRRHGPAGESWEGVDRRPNLVERLSRCPWWFTARCFTERDFDEKFELMPRARPFKTFRFLYDYELLHGYDSWNDHVPAELYEEVERVRARAGVVADLPRWPWARGHALPVALPPLDLWWPVAELGKERGFRPMEEKRAEVHRMNFLRSMGYFPGESPDGAVPPPEDPPAPAEVVSFKGRIEWLEVMEAYSGAVEASCVEDKTGEAVKLVFPRVIFDRELDTYRGHRLRCRVNTWAVDDRVVAAVRWEDEIRVWPAS